MVTNKSKIHYIVSSLFATNVENVIALLNRYQLADLIDKYYTRLLSFDEVSNQLEAFSATYLTAINSKISLSKGEDKILLEYIISDISKAILIEFIEKSQIEPETALKKIIQGLESSCDLNDWNFNEIKRLFQIDIKQSLEASNIKKSNYEYPNHWYQWKSTEYNLVDLANSLLNQKVIVRKNQFLDLFKGDCTNNKLSVDPNKLSIIFVLFDELNNLRLIQPKGYKSKKFTPLKYRMIDHDNNFVVKKDPKRLMEFIKKDSRNYNKTQGMVNKWLLNFEKSDGL